MIVDSYVSCHRLSSAQPKERKPSATLMKSLSTFKVAESAREYVRVYERAREYVRVYERAGEYVRVYERAGEYVRVYERAGEYVSDYGRAGEFQVKRMREFGL